MLLPADRHHARANGTAGARKHASNSRVKTKRCDAHKTRREPLSEQSSSPEDPWLPQMPIFQIDDDVNFQKKVRFVNRYASRLSRRIQKMEKDSAVQDEWRTLAEIINRFFMVMTVVGFSLTALLFYLLAAPRQ